MAGQLGLIARRQAAGAGMTPAQIRTLLETGEWARVTHSIYVSASVPPSLEQRVLAWCLRRDGNAWASHRTAARLHGLAGGTGEPIEITVAQDLRTRDIVVHHARLPIPDRSFIGPVPVTGVERTLLDLAGVVDAEVLDDAVDDALMKRLTEPRKIEWRLRRLGGRGRSGASVLRTILEERLSERTPVGSRLERRFLRAVRNAGFPKPLLQFPIELPSGKSALADFAYPQHRLLVEVLGYRWHGGRARWESDLVRSSELATLGWKVLYVTRQQLREAQAVTMARLGRALGVATLPLGP